MAKPSNDELAKMISRLKYPGDRDMLIKTVETLTAEPETRMVIVLMGGRPMLLHKHLHATALLNAAGCCLQMVETLAPCGSDLSKVATAVAVATDKYIEDSLHKAGHLRHDVKHRETH